jgi:hypothetical protein
MKETVCRNWSDKCRSELKPSHTRRVKAEKKAAGPPRHKPHDDPVDFRFRKWPKRKQQREQLLDKGKRETSATLPREPAANKVKLASLN